VSSIIIPLCGLSIALLPVSYQEVDSFGFGHISFPLLPEYATFRLSVIAHKMRPEPGFVKANTGRSPRQVVTNPSKLGQETIKGGEGNQEASPFDRAECVPNGCLKRYLTRTMKNILVVRSSNTDIDSAVQPAIYFQHS
jgi:hypothetical protein